jgi:hypothetical protein
MVILGEVHTGLVQHSSLLSPGDSERALSGIRPGELVLRTERPTPRAVSPVVFTGVDCLLPSRNGAKVRGAGTVSTRAIIVGGRVLQGSSHTGIATGDRRFFWSHYLSRPGSIEAIGKADPDDVIQGFVAGRPVSRSLSVESICARAMDAVQRSPLLDLRPPMRAPRTCLRWTLDATGEENFRPRGRFTVNSATLRTLELSVGLCDIDHVVALCEDLALHDWLLSTLSSVLDVVRVSDRPPTERIVRLGPVIEHLLHLWMPGAHVAEDLMPVWDDFERSPGYTRQWNSLVAWIRDQMSIITMSLLHTRVLADGSDQLLKNT